MKKITIVFTATLLLILNIGCNDSKKMTTIEPPLRIIDITVGTSEKLYAHKWELVMLNNKEVNNKSFLAFMPGQVKGLTGNTGCNNLSGSYTFTSYNTIKFSAFATTKRACLPDNSASETTFLKALAETNTWSANDIELFFYNENVLLMKFKAVTNSNITTGLQGNWELNYISGKKIAFEGLYPDKKPQITFDVVKNQVTGNTSCNNFNSLFTLNGSSINFPEQIAMTRMACPGEGESTFLEMIKKINRYTVIGNTLNLLIGDIAVMRFKKK